MPDKSAPATVVSPELIMSSNDITPTNEPVLNICLKLLDPEQLVFVAGQSPLLRLIDAWGSESTVRELAFFRNRSISDFVRSRCEPVQLREMTSSVGLALG